MSGRFSNKLDTLCRYMATDRSDEWDSTRLVDTLLLCLEYRDMDEPVLPLERPMHTPDRKDSKAVHFRRLLSALDGFNAPVDPPSEFNYNLMGLLCVMADKDFSDKLKYEAVKLLEDVKVPKIDKARHDEIFSFSERINMIQSLLYYLYRAKDFKSMWNGVYCCPASKSIAMCYTQRVTDRRIDEAASKVKELICVLLGDRYQNTSVSTRILIRKYNYPSVSDKELGAMEYDEMYS